MIGSSLALRRALSELSVIVKSDCPVLVLGESGTGKDVVARMIHELGARCEGPYIAQNCAALPPELAESELFGHAGGAFTGASAQGKAGLMELARGGTFLLDEVGELSPAVQAKLLRVVEDKEVRRVGDTRLRSVDFRLMCATNRDINRELEAGHFRRDLFHRINVFTLTLPPLREREGDITELARHFAARAAERLGRACPELGSEALELLAEHDWPGNVRELANVMDRAVALAGEGPVEPGHLRLGEVRSRRPRRGGLRDTLHDTTLRLVSEALAAHGGNIAAAARSLGVARQQMQRLVRRHGLRPEEFRSGAA